MKFVYIYLRTWPTTVVPYNSYCEPTSEDADFVMWSSFVKFLIFIYSLLKVISPNIVPTKSSRCTISYLYRLAKYQHTRTLQEIQWYMCTAVQPVQFLLMIISCYMLENELVLVYQVSSHVPSCMCTVDWASPILQLTILLIYFLVNTNQEMENGGSLWNKDNRVTCLLSLSQIISSWLRSTPNTPV